MSKRRTARDKRHAKPPQDQNAWLTVGWMLVVMTALVCELAALAVHLSARRLDPVPATLAALGVVLLFASLIVGVISLLMLPVVLKTRRDAVPIPILVFAIVVGAAPLAMLMINSVR